MLKECRCGKCNKLLARVGEFSRIQIKCPRCGTLNHVKTMSLANAPSSLLPSLENRDDSANPIHPSNSR